MSNVAKLKKKAVEFEQKRQYNKALALYVQVLDETAAAKAEPEVALYNRVGDLLLRLGKTDEAITYYRQAIELYAEGGFLNNAIALCNKILRHDPGQTAVHYTLGRISAAKGFRSDAKFHFLEYVQRMQRAGALDESFRALKEFADLCPEQDDIRLMLAEQLSKHGRSAEAVEQLQMLHEKLSADGRTVEARATAERMAAIDPSASPRTGVASPTPKAVSGLVFLDVSWEEEPRAGAVGTPSREAPAAATELLAVEPTAPAGAGEPAASPIESILDEAEASTEPGDAALSPTVAGLESTMLEVEPSVEAPTLELDPRPASDDDFGLRDFAPLPAVVAPPAAELPMILPALAEPLASNRDDARADDEGSIGPELTFIMPDDDAAADPVPLPSLELIPGALPTGSGPDLPVGPPSLDEPVPAAAAIDPAGNGAANGAFVNLGAWLRDDEPPKSTRMVVGAVEPGEGEEFDFDDMLRKFKRSVAENVDEDDHESHYDLGVAFREMGLVDEAIMEFQKALRGHGQRVRTYEALGQCFVDKGQHQIAVGVLTRATAEAVADDQLLVGVLYLLGVANEAVGRGDEALALYQRVFAVDINFRDVEDRLSALERSTR